LLEVQAAQQCIVTDAGTFSYDYLVLAMGCSTNFFGDDLLQRHAYPMKSTVEALNIRYAILENLETAVHASSAEQVQRLMNIVIVGAGPTGVELSGTLAEMKRTILPKDFPQLDFNRMHIYLVEGSEHTLPAMSAKSRQQSRRYLEELGVNLILKTVVTQYNGQEVHLSNGTVIPAATVIWAAGVKGNTPAGLAPEVIVKSNRIKVDRFNKVPGHENVFVIGDLAYMETPNYPTGHPQVCNVALKHAERLAYNFKQWEGNNSKAKPFEYTDPGTMATVGRNKAVVDDFPFEHFHFGGIAAWFAWMGFHLLQLIGVKNRIVIFVNWVYQYLTYDQSLRLLFKDRQPPRRKPVTGTVSAEENISA
jgi:NADH dehydrogenase